MKIRIKGNRIRLRLTKSDVLDLKESGVVEEVTVIAPGKIFRYALSKSDKVEQITADFSNNEIRIILPVKDATIITDSERIGVESFQDNGEEEQLFLLIEKDLKCLDHSREDQSDMYENPNKTC